MFKSLLSLLHLSVSLRMDYVSIQSQSARFDTLTVPILSDSAQSGD